MGKLIIVRHGTTALNADGDRIRGWIDVPLNSDGVQEAVTTGKKLSQTIHLDGIITSDLKRAVQTAEEIAKATGAPILFKTRALRPWNLGDLQGKKASDIIAMVEHLIMNPNIETPSGESFDTFRTRTIDFLHTLPAYNHQNIAIVTHYRVERLWDAWTAAGQERDGIIAQEVMANKGEKPGNYRVVDYPHKI